jgi:hypothetical protein
MNPEPVTAWLVRPGDTGGGAVTLRLMEGVLSLSTPEEELRLDATAITKVRRARLSPVIKIVYREAGERSVMFIYFVHPSSKTWTQHSFAARHGGLERTAEAVRLAAANRELKPMVEGWVRAIRGAAGRYA